MDFGGGGNGSSSTTSTSAATRSPGTAVPPPATTASVLPSSLKSPSTRLCREQVSYICIMKYSDKFESNVSSKVRKGHFGISESIRIN